MDSTPPKQQNVETFIAELRERLERAEAENTHGTLRTEAVILGGKLKRWVFESKDERRPWRK